MSVPRVTSDSFPVATLLTKEDAEEYTQSLGQVVAGGYRQVALGVKLGVPQALGISTVEWVERRLGGYVRMSIEDRRAAAVELTAEGMTQREAAKVLGVGKSTVNDDLAVRNRTEEAQPQAPVDESSVQNRTPPPDLFAEAEDAAPEPAHEEPEPEPEPEPTPKEEAAAESKSRREVSRSASILPDSMDYRIGDAREVMDSVPDSSVNLVLTDPPYGDKAKPLYEWLAEWSARVLIPGGSLICYTGQSRLGRDIRIFDEHLRYWWLLTMRHDRSQRLPGKFVVAESKPVLWYVKEYRRGRTLINDNISSERDLSAHPWAQGSGGVAFLIENLTDPGEFVADPFAGTGRWGEITAQMGRRWVGCDVVSGGAAEVVS